MNCSGIIARVIQHEYDHLQGVLFTDRLSNDARNSIDSELNDISTGKVDSKYEMSFYQN